MNVVKVTHLGEDYGKITVGRVEYEVDLNLARGLRDYLRSIEHSMPAKTSIVQTRSKEYAAGAISIIDMVKAALAGKDTR